MQARGADRDKGEEDANPRPPAKAEAKADPKPDPNAARLSAVLQEAGKKLEEHKAPTSAANTAVTDLTELAKFPQDGDPVARFQRMAETIANLTKAKTRKALNDLAAPANAGAGAVEELRKQLSEELKQLAALKNPTPAQRDQSSQRCLELLKKLEHEDPKPTGLLKAERDLDNAYFSVKEKADEQFDRYRTTRGDLSVAIETVNKARSSLDSALEKAAGSVVKVIGSDPNPDPRSMLGTLAPLSKLGRKPPVPALESVLTESLDNFPTVLQYRLAFAAVWAALQEALKAELGSVADAPLKAVEEALAHLDKQLQGIAAGTTSWADLLIKETQRRNDVANGVLDKYQRDGFKYRSQSLEQVRHLTSWKSCLDGLIPIWTRTLVVVPQPGIDKILTPNLARTSAKTLEEKLRDLVEAGGRLAVTLELLKGDRVYDQSEWEQTAISLYYWDDAAKLLRVLSPDAREQKLGDELAATDLEAARKEVHDSTQDLLNARRAVSDAQFKVGLEVARLREEARQAQMVDAEAARRRRAEIAGHRDALRKAEADLRDAETDVAVSRRKLALLEIELNDVEARVTRRKAELDALPEADTGRAAKRNELAQVIETRDKLKGRRDQASGELDRLVLRQRDIDSSPGAGWRM